MATLDVLVVGAGPVGLTAAIELARLGATVRIVDREGSRTGLSKAVGVNARSLELLEPSGLSERLLAAGIRISRANLHFDGAKLVTMDLSRVRHRYNFILALPQSETERVLDEALVEPGVAVERETEMIRLAPGMDRVTAFLKDAAGEREVSAPHLLGADGARSQIRQTLAIPFVGQRYEETWSLADVTLDWDYGYGEINLFMRRDGDLLFTVPIARDRIRAISQTGDALALLPFGAAALELDGRGTDGACPAARSDGLPGCQAGASSGSVAGLCSMISGFQSSVSSTAGAFGLSGGAGWLRRASTSLFSVSAWRSAWVPIRLRSFGGSESNDSSARR